MNPRKPIEWADIDLSPFKEPPPQLDLFANQLATQPCPQYNKQREADDVEEA